MAQPPGPSLSAGQRHLALEAELAHGPCRFVRERLRLPMGHEGSYGWLRHPPSVMVVPQAADGRLLLMRRCRPAVGRWVLEFPSGPLEPEEGPAAGAARLVRQLTGRESRGWRPLGQLRPNPGYSDELMSVGRLAIETGHGPAAAEPTLALWLCTPQALSAALSSLEEPVDGRSASAWFLAQRREAL